MTFEDTIGRSRSREPVIKIHGAEAFAALHKAGRLTAAGLDMLGSYVKPGVTTQRLDELAFQFAMDNGAYPATLFYRGYTKSICTSINHVVCHGIPDDKPLREGDVLNIDYTLIVDGWHGDSSRMYGVGEISRKAERLIEITYESLLRGIKAVRAGAHTGDIGFAIQRYARRSAARWCATSAATASAASSTTRRTSCITAAPARAWSSSPGWSSPSSR